MLRKSRRYFRECVKSGLVLSPHPQCGRCGSTSAEFSRTAPVENRLTPRGRNRIGLVTIAGNRPAFARTRAFPIPAI